MNKNPIVTLQRNFATVVYQRQKGQTYRIAFALGHDSKQLAFERLCTRECLTIDSTDIENMAAWVISWLIMEGV